MFAYAHSTRRSPRASVVAVVVALVATMLVTTFAASPRGVLADTGEAAFGTPTQALQAAISLGNDHTCVIKNSNLLCWGDNTWGKLGNGTEVDTNKPTYVLDRAGSTDLLSGVIGIIASENHTCALLNTTKVKCWGLSWRIGKQQSSGVASPHPTFVKSLYTNQSESDASPDLTGAVALSATSYNTCAVINDGRVKCWGDSAGGGKVGSGVGYVLLCTNDSYASSCGSGQTSNVQLTGVKQLSMSDQTACAVKTDETQVCWGTTNGVYGYEGSDPPGSRVYASSADPGTNGAKAMAPSGYTSCGLFEKVSGQAVGVSGGQVKCWGKNGSRALGRGEVITDNIATNYSAANVPDVNTALAISGERQAFCALLFDRTVKCWGDNPNGKASVGAVGTSGTPRLMRTGDLSSAVIGDIYAVSVGGTHICIIIGLTGNVKCSGTNTNGQLGDGTTTTSAVNMVTVTDTTGSGSLTGAGADNMPPTYSSSAVNAEGTKVILTYNEVLSAAGTIPTGLFTVKVGDVVKTISSVTVNGLTVELNMTERIAPGAVVRMSYSDLTTNTDDSNVLEDASFNDSSSIPEAQIANGSNTEAVAPTLVSAAIDTTGEFLTLTYSEALGTTTAPTTAFAVTYGGSSRTPTARSVSAFTIVLTLSPRAQRTDTVTAAYTAPTADLATTNTAVQDSAGNDAATFSASAVTVTNSSTYDTVAPTFVSAAVSGDKTKVVLTYNESLGATTALAGAFAVTVDSLTRAVSTVAVSGSTVELTLASSVNPSEAVTVAYTAPTPNVATTNNAVQDVAGNDAVAFAATTVENIEDTTPPTLVSGAVNSLGTKLILTYNESLNSTTAAASAFAVTVATATRGVSSVAVSGSTVELTLDSAVGTGFAVTVAYTAPALNTATSNAAIQDGAGNDALSFSSSAISVTNSSTVDQTPPGAPTGAVNAGGDIVLTYSETLSSTTAPTSAFAVTVDGVTVTVVSVTVTGGNTVVIVTSPLVGAGQAVSVVYTDPTTGNDTNAVQDSSGNDVASSGSAVSISTSQNLSALDLTRPVFVSSQVTTAGGIVMTFSETLGANGPATSAFTVTVDGESFTVTGVSIVGTTVVITTTPGIPQGKAVSIIYADPTTGNDANAIQDAAGNDVSGSTFSVSASDNASTIDVSPPASSGAQVRTDGKLVLTFAEALASPGPGASAFTVTVDGAEYTVTGVTTDGNTVVITTSPAIPAGSAVSVAYRDPTAGNDTNGLQDAAGNDVPSATFTVATGGNTSAVDGTPPVLSGSEVNTDGKLVLTFSETLVTTPPDASTFTVTVDGATVTVVSVEVVDNKIVITTSPPIAPGQSTTWSYAKPPSGGTGSIKDSSGNELMQSASGATTVTNTSKVVSGSSSGGAGDPLNEAGDDPKATLLSDEATLDAASGTVTFSDGSQVIVTGNTLKIRFKTGYIGKASGTVTGTYLVGKKKVKYKCTVASFGKAAKVPNAKRTVPSKNGGKWFVKKFYSPTKPCKVPPALKTALTTQRITFTVRLKFARLWPTTAKAVEPTGAKLPPVTRIMKLKIGKVAKK